MLDLPPSAIHLWLANCGEIDPELLSSYRVLLSDEERTQEPRFRLERGRRRYLVSRALVRFVLSRYAPLAPNDWNFTANEYGRPEINNDDASFDGLTFNLSHSNDQIVLAVARHRALGVDIEHVRFRENALDIAGRYFAAEEAAALAALPIESRTERFLEHWTFKESYMKARGVGLGIPLDKVGFHLGNDGHVAFFRRAGLRDVFQDRADRWQFWQLRPTSEYIVALCAERNSAEPPHLVVRTIVPAVSDEVIEVACRRTS